MQAAERAKNAIFCSWWPWPLTFDLDIQTHPIDGPNTCSVWIWCKSVQWFQTMPNTEAYAVHYGTCSKNSCHSRIQFSYPISPEVNQKKNYGDDSYHSSNDSLHLMQIASSFSIDLPLLLSIMPSLFMVALCNRADHYIFALWFLSFFFFSSPNVRGRRLDVYHTSTHGVALVRI